MKMDFKATRLDKITPGVSVEQEKGEGLRLRPRQPVSLGAYYAPGTLISSITTPLPAGDYSHF